MQGFYLECRNFAALAATSDVFNEMVLFNDYGPSHSVLLSILMAVQGPSLPHEVSYHGYWPILTIGLRKGERMDRSCPAD